METSVGDLLHCEEQLRTTLHCDDKEKLRKKLAQLQREYLRTAQRLQRAERLDAVRRHVRSRITQHNQTEPQATCDPSALILDSSDTSGAPQCQEHTEGAAHSDNPRRSQGIRFLLPSDVAFPQTPDPDHVTHRGHRPSLALRLRSRRSRLRRERRSSEVNKSTGDGEKGQEPSERRESAQTAGLEEEKVRSELPDAVNESEELFSGTDSESPSLLLTHWNTHTDTGDVEGKKNQMEKETELNAEGKKESPSLLLTCCSPTITTDEKENNSTENGKRKEVERGEDGENCRAEQELKLCEENRNSDTKQNPAEKTVSEKNPDYIVEIKEKMNGITGDGKSVSLLDSCTLVEGLLFPVEYYVRTTRRMTSSQSQPDMQAVILSQLNTGRNRRGCGRGRGPRKRAAECSDQHTPTDFSSPTAVSTSADLLDASVAVVQPARGRRKRGRGRGRPRTPRSTSTPVFDSQSLHGADGPKPCLTPGENDSVKDEAQPASSHSTNSQISSGVNETPSNSGSGPLDKVYPIFMKSTVKTNGSLQKNRSTACWRSLLLPSSPLTQTSQLPLLSLSPRLLFSSQMNSGIIQDFHLPDDQFASMKLHKLRQIAVESGVEDFSSPSSNTRSRYRHSDPCCNNTGDMVVPLPLSLSLTPTIANSPHYDEVQQAAAQSVDLKNLPTEHKRTDEWISQSLTDRDMTETNEEGQTENLQAEIHSSLTHSLSLVQVCGDEDDCLDKYKEHETVALSSTHGDNSQPCLNFTDRLAGQVNDCVNGHSDKLHIKQPACYGVDDSVKDQRSVNPRAEALSFDLLEVPEEPSNTALQTSNDIGESPVKQLNVKAPAEASKQPPELNTNLPAGGLIEDKDRGVHAQLLLISPQASALCPFITPHLPLTSSPALPSLGLTPHPVTASLALTSSPSAPPLSLPPPHSPSTQALSPPALSPCPSITYLPLSLPPDSPSRQIQASPELAERNELCHGVEPGSSSVQLQDSGGQVDLRAKETAEKCTVTHTLKAAAGGFLVDACCFSGSSSTLYVAAAGKWAVCLWSQTSPSDWSLIHTWTFNEPVINVFSVPDAAGLLCVTLGQLEIREVRMLSCSSLVQRLFCEGVIQAVVGVSESRVVTSSPSARGSTLQVFTLSDSSSSLSSQPLASPGVCVGALAPVDGLSDALVGTDESGQLFVWNLKSGQLLRRVPLGDDLSHTACLTGYSHCGVLFVLLQHHFLNSLEEEEKEAKIKDEMFKKEMKNALFSLVAINPLSGKSVLAIRLYPPEVWRGRLCEADVNGTSVVGLSQNGCMCVWELGRRGASRMLAATESKGWQLVRWGGADMLVIGHHNGDVTLHHYSPKSPCH